MKVLSSQLCVLILGTVVNHEENSERKNGEQEFQDVREETLGGVNHEGKFFEMAEIEHMFAELQETMSSIRMELSAEESIKEKGKKAVRKVVTECRKTLLLRYQKKRM